MAMWPRVDLELVEDLYAESPWRSRWFLRIHTDVPLEDNTVPEIKAALDRGKPTGDFTRVLEILSRQPVVSDALRGDDPETRRTWATLAAALTPQPGDQSK